MITRRQSLKRLLGVAAPTITAPTINRGWFQLFTDSATKYSARAIDLVQRSTVVDMLNPFTLLGMLAPIQGGYRTDPWRELSQSPGTNLDRLKLIVTRRLLGIISTRC